MPLPLHLTLLHPDAEMCDAFARRFEGLADASVVRSTVEDLAPHDAFVTAGNAYGIMTAGVDAAVVRICGEPLMRRVQDRILDDYLGEQPVGTAFVIDTGLDRLPFVVHAPTMRTPGSIGGTDKVYVATWAALLAIYQHNVSDARKIGTAAMPAVGTGFGGVPFDEAARQMAAAYRHYRSPPHRLNWDTVTDRQLAICYDGRRQVAPG